MMTRYFDKLCLFLSKGSKFDLWHGSLALHDSKVCQTRVQNTHRKLKLGKFYTHVILNRNPLHFVPLSRRNPNLDLWHGNLAPSPSKFRQKKYKIQKENKTLQRKFNTLVVLSVNTLRQVSSWPPKHTRPTAQKCPPPPRWTRVCLLALPPKFFFLSSSWTDWESCSLQSPNSSQRKLAGTLVASVEVAAESWRR